MKTAEGLTVEASLHTTLREKMDDCDEILREVADGNMSFVAAIGHITRIVGQANIAGFHKGYDTARETYTRRPGEPAVA